MIRRPILFIVAAVLVLAACGGSDSDSSGVAGGGPSDTQPPDEAPIDTTPPEPVGEFASADNCSALVDEALDAYRDVLVDLGDADRTDTRRIDAAMEAFSLPGPDLSNRYEDLECGDDFDDALCAAVDTLEPGGEVGQDVVDGLAESCTPAARNAEPS